MDKGCYSSFYTIFARNRHTIMKYSRNPLSGRNCSGFRFRFNVPSISPRTLFLPLEMKSLPQIRPLIQGISPLVACDCKSPHAARKAFRSLRKIYDFDYWALREYFITDRSNPDSIIPLRLNEAQLHVIDIFRKRFFEKKTGRYIVSKSIRHCGLSTCIQAYIHWMQTYHCHNNSYLCGPSEISLMPLKRNLCRHLHRDIATQRPWVFLPKVDGRAFFNTFRNPDFLRGINLGFVHFADMSRWRDAHDRTTSRTYITHVSAVLLDYRTLVVLEGDAPLRDVSLPKRELSQSFSNPFFIYKVMASKTSPNPYFMHIHIGSPFSDSCL